MKQAIWITKIIANEQKPELSEIFAEFDGFPMVILMKNIDDYHVMNAMDFMCRE